MGLFSRIFGGGGPKDDSKELEPIEYMGFLIYPQALAEHGQYRVAGRITKIIDEQTKEHRFIRSDVLALENDANELMLKKAQMFIDQSGDSIFG
ncbi:HlyU family transcriptional regulator [Vibrio ostreicida]|uniref:HlyU family transcriptional regulator n=1 Tax=Vibrio ostreicida TaxID=526588 RepID=A0ABT8BXW5_9VIBR|nr:HlyU family transcriptional regulator [Vibrio ostreicida]MDN3611667.1 HlyU family transcriptional regulator [Vibrio ostreicida]NPD10134.1 transcriptional regulator [Vibrio ostreicida]